MRQAVHRALKSPPKYITPKVGIYSRYIHLPIVNKEDENQGGIRPFARFIARSRELN